MASPQAPTQVRAVCDEYLEVTRGVSTDTPQYEKVEPFAWKRLKVKLKRLGVKVPDDGD